MQPLSEPLFPAIDLPARRLSVVEDAELLHAPVTALPLLGEASPAGAALALAVKPCTCGHAKGAHEHYRRGTDCALCGCARFHRPPLLTRLKTLGR